jgi:hypothetical protein
MGGAQPVARYDFAGRHPHPQYVFSQKPKDATLFRVPKKKLAGKFHCPGEILRGMGWQEYSELPGPLMAKRN